MKRPAAIAAERPKPEESATLRDPLRIRTLLAQHKDNVPAVAAEAKKRKNG